MESISIEGKQLQILNPQKELWHGITKMVYIRYLLQVAPQVLPYTRNRMLMVWKYPNGINQPKEEKRSIPEDYVPEWLPTTQYNNKTRILINDAATLIWVANEEALELHVPFDRFDKKDYPTEIAFDIDSMVDDFDATREVVLELKIVLDSLNLMSIAKTSGGLGLHVFVPIEVHYTFEQTREITKFVANILIKKIPDIITLERSVKYRGDKVYFDYLQLWRGRTLAASYSVRARPQATVSTPVTWEEIKKGILPTDFTLFTVPERIQKIGDLFSLLAKEKQNVDPLLKLDNEKNQTSLSRYRC
jgi:bifunctional non-homologous end joining protein LigD